MTNRGRTASRRILTAAVVTALGGALTGTGVASAAPPDADSVIELMPGPERADSVVITDDAVYFVTYSATTPSGGAVATLYRRAFSANATGLVLGVPVQFGRIVPESSFAVHEGTVAYIRAVDGRLVLRAPSGMETVPSWGDAPELAAGVVDLSAEWLVVNDYPYDPMYTLMDRQTGTMYDLGDLVQVPAGYPGLGDSGIDVTDTQALWGMYSENALGTAWYHAVFTVTLGANGPTGGKTTLQATNELIDPAASPVYPIGFDGTRALWQEIQCDSDDCTTVVHRSEAPYSSSSSFTVGPGRVIGTSYGRAVLDDTVQDGVSHLAWKDIMLTPNPSTHTLDVPGYATATHNWLVAFVSGVGASSEAYLADAVGDTLTGNQAVPPSVPFTDVRGGDPFTDEILWLYDHGVVGGYADGTFRLGASVNRDAMAAFLYRMAHDGADAPACSSAAFTDVPAAHPFCGEIRWLSTTGITTGWPDGTFRPGTPVTREAMAAFLYRFAHAGAHAPTCVAKPFTDVAVANQFCGEIDWMADAGISTGWPDGSFHPAATIERQAMAAFLFRFIDAGLVLN